MATSIDPPVRDDSSELLARGAYARKQLFSPSALIAWSHRSRFRLGRRLVEPYAGGRILDYGSGDGTFLLLVRDLFPGAVGADIDPQQVDECRARFHALTDLSFLLTTELGADEARFDVITCMEVLEHLPETSQRALIETLRELIAPGGRVIISVPIEIGPTLVAKQIARRIAGWRGIGDYRYNERYSLGELVRMSVAVSGTRIHRPIHRTEYVPGVVTEYYGHKGFNWRVLRREIERLFTVVETRFSPLNVPMGLIGSQVWFVCVPR